MKERVVGKRLINVFLMLFITVVAVGIIGYSRMVWLDQMLAIFVVSIVFFVLFLFVLEHHRAKRTISNNYETDFRKVLKGYLIASIAAVACSFLPEFLRPVIVIPLCMIVYSNQGIALSVGIFWNAILALTVGLHVQELVLYCLMTLFGAMLAEAMEYGRILWYNLIIFCLSVMMPGLFYYLTYQEVRTSLFLIGAIEGAVICGFITLFFKNLVDERDAEVSTLLDDMIDNSFFMVHELSRFSKKDYNHARRVSELAAKCAEVVGADKKICRAAGFYYRIGIIDGEPIRESGIRIAQEQCFPEEVIRIISEYNDEENPPSTVESAIIHMVDGVIKKMEVLDQTTMSSEWNQDMVIYQTLNEFSAKGLYDKAGISMNMFLKIREYLVKEGDLL
ncbi:MAG: hypothetical protein PUA75_00080 [Clostridiales bacterium]|nr:hypothetical protein [Clostridiales bacterium]